MKGISDRSNVITSNRAIYPASKLVWYFLLLAITKCVRGSCIFASYDVLKSVHVVHFLCFIKVVAGILLIFFQKPISSGKKLTKEQWWRICKHAVFSNSVHLLWLFGLTLCGPLRSALLFEHNSFNVIMGVNAFFSASVSPAKTRGAVFFLLGVFSLLLFDNDSLHNDTADHPEGQHHGFSHLFYFLVSRTGVADHKGGVIILVVSLFLNTLFQATSRKLAVEIGGAKRLHSLSSLLSGILLIPVALFLSVAYEPLSVPLSNVFLPLLFIAIFMFVLDYYVDSICSQKFEMEDFARYSTLTILCSVLVFSFIWNSNTYYSSTGETVLSDDHVLSAGVIFSSFMFIFATILFSSSSNTGSKGKFVGYSATGLPLYTFAGDTIHKSSGSMLTTMKNGLKQILEESDSRKIFYFLCLNMVFTFVELLYGIWTNSLGLISDGFHMMFDCSALVMGLYAALMSRWKPTPTFSFGYGRVEVLSGFINGLFLVVIAFFVFTEALNRLLDPPEIKTERLLVVSVAGLIVNMIGIFAFHRGGHSHSIQGTSCHSSQQSHHSHHPAHPAQTQRSTIHNIGHHHHQHQHQHQHHLHHGHSHGNANMQGVFLHVLADTLGSVGVIVSSILIENVGWFIADPICSLFISTLIFLSVLPLLKESSLILLLRIPATLQKELSNLVKEVLSIDGVVAYRNQHFWWHSSNSLAGTLHVQVQRDVSEQKIISQVYNLFRDLDFAYLTIQVEKEDYFHYLSGLSSTGGGGGTLIPQGRLTHNLKDLPSGIKAI